MIIDILKLKAFPFTLSFFYLQFKIANLPVFTSNLHHLSPIYTIYL